MKPDPTARADIGGFLSNWRARLRRPQNRQVLNAWGRQIRSTSAVWILLPVLTGIFFVYWAQSSPHTQAWVAKAPQEIAAIVLMVTASGLFLARAWLYRLELDYLLLAMAVNFLCREIHFTGTDHGVVAVAAGALVLTLYWLERILDSLRRAPLVRLALMGTFASYLLALLIQRRVFGAGRLPLLPDEVNLHVSLEEVIENIAHLYFIFIAVAGFLQLRRRPRQSD